jgi:hypothetical protein
MCTTCAKRPIAGERSLKNSGPAQEWPALVGMDETLRRLRMAELSLTELTRKAVENMEKLSAVTGHKVVKQRR